MPTRQPSRPTLTDFRVTPRALHEFLIMPQFGDTLDPGGVTVPSTEEGDWSMMDNVVYQRPILELFGGQNVLKRKDATCKLIYSPVGKLGARYIRTEALYAAVEDCVEEFYQGCFIDFEQGNYDLIFENVMPILETGVVTDIFTNKYFGDVARPADPSGVWSWNKFDGIFKHIADYVANGIVPASQTYAIPGGTLTPQNAKDALEEAYVRQDYILRSFGLPMKAYYVDQQLYDAYSDYLILAGLTTIQERMNMVTPLRYRSIDLRVKQWDSVLTALNGGVAAHVCMLTLRSNWLYAADSSYGGGPRRNEAVRIWYSMDDNVWRRQIHLKAGTEWVAPQFTVLGMTSF